MTDGLYVKDVKQVWAKCRCDELIPVNANGYQLYFPILVLLAAVQM